MIGQDDLRARHQARLFARVDEHLARTSWDRPTLQAHQVRQLRALLGVAAANSAFHRSRLSGFEPSSFTLEELAALPVMTKADLMDHFDDIVTDPRLNRDIVEAHLPESYDGPKYLLDEYIVLTSGGSSGVRGLFVLGQDSVVDNVLAAIRQRFAPDAPALRPDRRPGPSRVALVAASAGYHGTAAFAGIFAGGLADIVPIPVTLPLHEQVAKLNDLQPDTVQGYPSAIAVLAAEQRAQRLDIRPSAVTFNGESFNASLRADVRATFEAPITNGFASSEGLFGTSVPDGGTVALAEDLCIVELVDADHQPVPPGTPSTSVLITNLFNPVLPLIRYEMNDVMIEHSANGTSGYRHVTIEGRHDNVFGFGSVVVHPLVFRSILGSDPDVVEYQVVQTHHGAAITVVSHRQHHADLQTRIVEALQQAGVTAPHVTVTAGTIQRREDTGKARRFIPLPP